MKNKFFGRQSVDSYSTLIRGSFLASFAKRFAAFAFVMLFAIPQMWGADMPYFSAIAANSSTKTPLSNVSAASSAGGKASVMVTKCTTDNSYVTFTLNSDVKSVFNNGANSIFLCFSVDKDIQMSLCRSSNSNLKVVAYNDGSKISEIESPVLMASSSNFFSFKADYTYYISTTSTSGNSFSAVRAYFKKMDDGTNVTVSGWWVESLPKAQTIITLDKNEGDANSSVSATKGESLPTFTAVTRDGYDLTGYFTSVTDGTKVINAEGTLVASTTYTDANAKWNSEVATLTLYAQWKVAAAKHDVIFNHGDGSGNMASVKVSEGAEYALPACTFTAPEGKEFEKWTVDNGIGDKAVGDKFVMPTTDVTATAQWFVNPCKAIGYGTDVAFTKGAANGNLSITSVGGTWETGKTPFKDATSSNWCKASSGSNYITGSFGGKSIATLTVSAATSKTDANKVCAVAFSSESTFDSEKLLEVSEGKTVHLYNVNHTSGERSIIELTAPAGAKSFALGRNFSFGAADGDYKNSGDRYFYYIAACMAEEHTVSFEKGDEDASGSMNPVDVAEGDEYTIPACKFTAPSGKEFDKWVSDDVTITDGKFTMPASDVTLTATWKTATQKWIVTYMDGETTLGTETVEDGAKATKYSDYESKPLSEFKGWFDAATEGNSIDFTAKTIDDDLTAYGRWEKAYAQTANFVEAATGTKPDISTFLSGLNYAISSMDNVSWDDQPSAQADQGLKIEKSGTTLSFWVEADKRVKIKVGTLEGVDEGTAGVSVDGGVNFETIYGANPQGTGEPKEYPYITTEETLFVIKINNGCPGTGGVYQWNLIQSISITGTTPHDITLNPATNGSFTVKGLTEGVTAVEGENVALVANPDPHYGLKEWSVYKTGDTETKVTVNNNSFVMPAYDVTVAATFELVTSTDATLSDLRVDGTTIAGFSSDKYEYNVELPYKSTDIPEVTATKNNEFASDPVITQATSLPGIATVKVTAEDETTTADYTVNFTVAPKDGICLIKGQVTDQNTVTITVGEGTGAAKNVKNTSTYGDQTGYKFNSRPAYVGITLAEGQFQAGDVVNVFVTSVAVGNDGNNPVYQPMRVFSNNTTDDLASCLLVEKESNMVQGVNTVVLPEGCNTNTIYLCRGGADKTYDIWNPYIAYIEVLRPMNPMLTKATILEKDATIDESAKTVTVEVPYSTDITAVTPAFEYISNDNSKVVISPAEAQDFTVAKTYRFTDKDGDYTEYTVSITKAEPSHDAELKELKVGEDAITLVEGTYAYTYKYAYGAEVPTNVTAKANSDVAKSVDITQADAQTKLASIVVTAEDEVATQTYTITFTEAAKPAETPTITAQPASHDYLDTDVIQPLTVEASTTDEGILSYQWYKDDVVIEGATAASYTPDQAGNYKVVVTNTLGTKTASATSNVAVITITHIYTFASWDGSSATFTKEGEWTIYPYNKDNKWLIEDVKFAANQVISYVDANKKANIFNDQYFVVKFEKDMKNIVIANYYSGSDRYVNGLYSVVLGDKSASQKGTATEITSSYDITYTGRSTNTDRVTTTTINGHFESGVYYVFKMNGTGNAIYDFIATPAEIEEESASLTAGKIDGIAMTNAQLAELNGESHTLTLTKSAIFAPAVEFTYEHKITYKDGHEKTIVKTENGEPAEVSDKFEVSKEFDGVTYKVVCPIDNNPAMELSVETMDLSFSVSKASSKSAEVTLTGVNLTDGEYSFDEMPIGLSISPASFKIENKVVDQKFTVEFAATEPVAIATKQISFSDGTTSKILTVTYGAVTTYTLQDVSETMTWDFTNKAAADAEVPGENDGTYRVLANYAGVKGTFPGQYMSADFNKITTGSLQGKGIKIHTTVPGMITIEFSNTGSKTNDRELYINGEPTGSMSKTTAHLTYSQMVEAGDVVLTAWEHNANQWNMLNFYKIEFTAAEVLRDNLTVGKLGTYCPARDIKSVNGKLALWNAVLYQPNYFSEPFYINFIEAAEINAGYGYVLAPEATTAYAIFDGDQVGEAVEASEETRGMQGYLGEEQSNIEDSESNIILKNNHLYTASGNYLTNGKAYICLDVVKTLVEIPEEVVQGAPVRRRMTLGAEQANTPTNLDGIMMKQGVHKFIRNNQMYILREGRLYNAQGKMMR